MSDTRMTLRECIEILQSNGWTTTGWEGEIQQLPDYAEEFVHRNRFDPKAIVEFFIGRLGFGETVVISMYNPYSKTGTLTLRYPPITYPQTDGELKWNTTILDVEPGYATG